jgi:hypothetical protein
LKTGLKGCHNSTDRHTQRLLPSNYLSVGGMRCHIHFCDFLVLWKA